MRPLKIVRNLFRIASVLSLVIVSGYLYHEKDLSKESIFLLLLVVGILAYAHGFFSGGINELENKKKSNGKEG